MANSINYRHCMKGMGFIIAAALLLLPAFGGQSALETKRDGRWAILLAGASGDPDLQNMYLKELLQLRTILEGRFGFAQNHLFVLFDDPSRNPELIKGESTRENLNALCHSLAAKVQKEDLVFIFISGHGNYDGKAYKLNLVGPDPTASELASAFYSIPSQRFIIVNTTSCSGGSIAALSRKGTVMIAATKSGMEKNLSHFGEFIIDALKDAAADANKDGRVSMAEAFSFAAHKIEEYYLNEGILQTEHPVMDDSGGIIARSVFLDEAKATAFTEQKEQRVELEQQIEHLKSQKSSMSVQEYETKLEELLLKLARINAQHRN